MMHFPKHSSVIITDRTDEVRETDPSHRETVIEAEFVDEGITKRFWFSAIVATLGPGFQHGYNLGVTNTPQKVLIEWIECISEGQHKYSNGTAQVDYSHDEATFIFSLIVSVYSLGGILGGLLIYFWNRNVGFRKVLICSNVFTIIASFLMGFSKYRRDYMMMLAGRFLMGMNNGFCAGVVIMYLAEISPTRIRGTVCSIYQLFLVISIMVSQIVSVDVGLGGIKTWPLLFFLPTTVAVIQFLLLPFCEDPPFYLYETGKTSAARKAIRKLYGEELEDVKYAALALRVHYQMRRGKPQFGDLFSRAKYQSLLVISCIVMFAQQITGINVIIHYTSTVLDLINLEHISQRVILVAGIVNVCVTIASVAVVDVVGRRWLLIFTFVTMSIDMLAIFTCFFFSQYYHWNIVPYMAIMFMIMYVAFFASGAGSIPWFLYTEFFLENMRPFVASIVVPVNWLTHFFIGLPFLSLHKKLGASVFFIFAAMDFLLLIYIMRNIPETKNQSVLATLSQFTPQGHLPVVTKKRDSYARTSRQTRI